MPEDEETIDIITKDKNLFCVKNPYLELYFQVLEKNDPLGEEYYKTLKSL